MYSSLKSIIKHPKTVAITIVAILTFGLLFALQQSADETEASRSGNVAPVNFVSHKALYDIELSGIRSGSQIVNIQGQMLYELQNICDGWVTNHSFNILYEYADTPPLRIKSDFSTHERADGSVLNFTSQRKRNGDIFEALRGQALGNQKHKGEATFSQPEGLTYSLPPGTLFPIAHTQQVARQIANNQAFNTHVIFDGSDEDGPVQVSSFIGAVRDDFDRYKDKDAIDFALVDSPARNVRLAFFPYLDNQAKADYEMDLVFHENGIISDMLIDYQDFSVVQTLTAVEKIETSCDNGNRE